MSDTTPESSATPRPSPHRRLRAVVLMATVLLGLPLLTSTTAVAQGSPSCGGYRACGNLLVNGSFQFGHDHTPIGWTPDPYRPTASLVWDLRTGHTGHRSVRISDSNPTDSRWNQEVAVQPHTLYQLGGWIMTQDVVQGAESQFAGATLSILGVPDLTFDHALPPLFGTNDWTHVTMQFDSGEFNQVTVSARLGFFVGTASGTAWFDDISLVPVGAGALSADR